MWAAFDAFYQRDQALLRAGVKPIPAIRIFISKKRQSAFFWHRFWGIT